MGYSNGGFRKGGGSGGKGSGSRSRQALAGGGVELGSAAAVLLAVFSANLRFCGGARQAVRVGVGALTGVLGLS